MAGKAKKKVAKKKRVSQEPRKAHSRPVWALLLFTIAALVAVSIFDYNSGQYNTTPPSDINAVGQVGSCIGFHGFHYLGVAVFLIPIFLFWFGIRLLIQQERGKRVLAAIASPIAILFAAGLIEWIYPSSDGVGSIFEDQISNYLGGVFGEFLYQKILFPPLGDFGSFLIMLMGFTIGSILVFTDNLGRFLDYLQNTYRDFFANRAKSREARKARKVEIAEAKRVAKEEAARAKSQAKLERATAKKDKLEKSAPKAAKALLEDAEEDEAPEDDRKPSLLRDAPTHLPTIHGAAVTKAPAKKKLAPKPQEVVPEPKKPALDPATIKIISGQKTEKSVANIPERRGDYIFPPRGLLAEAPDSSGAAPEDHAGTMNALVRTLEEFWVKVIPGEIHTGPVITRYEVTPAAGVRVEKIVNLYKNIALGLKAMSVRILAPVPGKGTVGIEVPNKIAQAVCMRDIIESKAWDDAGAEIPVVLGQDVTGKPMVMDLTKMPHVLIAGSTGSGKTVCINAIIASLLYHSGPEDLRFIMVDPKVVEMQMYN